MREQLKPLVSYLLPVALVGIAASVFLSSGATLSLDSFTKACAKPLTYSVSAYDPRFGISEEEFAQAAREAAELWNIAGGKPLLAESASPDISINLLYDERQEATVIGEDISEEQRQYREMKAGVDALREKYAAATKAFERQEKTYEANVASYEKDVAYWNAQGGAPPSVYQELEREKASLERQRRALTQSVQAINVLVDQIQTNVTQINGLADQLNERVDIYNSVVGHDFDQGNYIEDKEGKRITIFEFADRMELKRVLAHEFGHALGISHTDDPDSIMYSYNIGDTFELTATDIASLKETCEL